MNDFITLDDLNILPLGSYDLLIGMDWLEKHKVILIFFCKTFTCLDKTGNTIKIKGIHRKVTIREIYSLQMKRSVCKGCKVFDVYVMDDKYNENKLKILYILVLKEFEYIFPEEVPGLPPKRDIDFTIDMIPKAVPTSKAPYRINIIDLT